MHVHSLDSWQHNHDFSLKNNQGERRTWYVLVLTAVTMIAEIFAGSLFGSMALLADGWHMSTHVAAFMITLFAYHYARKHANSPAFALGTGKVNVLGGFASAIALAVVALVMMIESMHRMFAPQEIHFNEAILVACIGLAINVISVFLLKDDHHHHHHEHHEHHEHQAQPSHSRDHNLQAAYMHVLADAMTSLLAIVALLAAKYFAWNWLDPVMGVVGAIIITRWSYGLLKQTAPILLDASIEPKYLQAVKAKIEQDADNRVVDLHVWKISSDHHAAILSLVTHYPQPIEHYQALLAEFDRLSHITIEVNQCLEAPCLAVE